MKKKIVNVVLAALTFVVLASFANVEAKSSSIPKDAFKYKGHSYYVYCNENLTWKEAKVACEKLGGHLVAFSDAKECEAIWQYVYDTVNQCVWIGLYNAGTPENPNWKWANDEKVVFTNWDIGNGQPGYDYKWNAGENEAYAGMGYHGVDLWDDFVNNGDGNVPGYVCEWDGYEISTDLSIIKLYPKESLNIDYSIVNMANQKEVNGKPSFKTSSKTVAKVSSSGKVVAVKPGICDITLSYKGCKNTITVIVLPNQVKGLKKTNVTKKNISLKWTAQASASGYVVYMYDPDLEEFSVVKTIKNGKTSTATITGLNSGTKYKFKVVAYVSQSSKKYMGDESKTITVKTK